MLISIVLFFVYAKDFSSNPKKPYTNYFNRQTSSTKSSWGYRFYFDDYRLQRERMFPDLLRNIYIKNITESAKEYFAQNNDCAKNNLQEILKKTHIPFISPSSKKERNKKLLKSIFTQTDKDNF
jgi:hypothetical protein